MGNLNPSIFRAYDIRGVVPGEITEEVAERVGRAMVLHTGASVVVVGRDMRTSSPALTAAVIRGVTAQGADVVDIGLCSTPMFNCAVISSTTFGAGIMVSASHNPARYNGFKLDRGDGLPIGEGGGMEEIAALVLAGTFPQSARQGVVREVSTIDAYLTDVCTHEDPAALPPQRIVACAGNGMAGLTLPQLASRIPGTIIPLHWELDGTFPHHEANPIKPENVRDVGEAVREERATMGFAFDGDADRVGVVDERGTLVRGDLVSVLLAQDVLRRQPGATILYDVRASRVVPEAIRVAGGVPVPSRVGHALIKRQLREVRATFGGELSGHFYFGELAGFECTELAMLRMLRILAPHRRPLSDLIAPLETTAYSGEVNFDVQDKDAAIRIIEERYVPHARAVVRIDGVKCDMGDWWFLVRASNTEPLLRLVVETSTQREMEQRVAELTAVIEGR